MTLLASAALAACTPDDPLPPPGPAPTSTPVFASDEEALAAAEEVYGEYLAATNQVAKSGWIDTDVLGEVARDRALEAELETAAELSTKHFRQVGDATFDAVTLQQVRDDGSAVVITAYLCLDVSSVDVVDADGTSVVSDSRPDRQALEIEIDNVEESLKVSRSEAWAGTDFC